MRILKFIIIIFGHLTPLRLTLLVGRVAEDFHLGWSGLLLLLLLNTIITIEASERSCRRQYCHASVEGCQK